MDLERAWQRLFFTRKQRLTVYRQLENLLQSNIKMDLALSILWNRTSRNGQRPNRRYAPILAAWQRQNRDGESFGQILAEWAPPSEQMLIEAGETAGDIPDALNQAIEMAESAGKIRNTLVSSLAYPTLLMLLLLSMLAGFSWELVPAFTQILPVERWTGAALMMYQLSQMVTHWFLAIVICLVLSVIAFFSTLGTLTGPTRIILDRLPPWNLYRIWQGAGFLSSIASLLKAGVPVSGALRRMRANANPYMRERIEGTTYFINEGANFGEALNRAGYDFPDRDIIEELEIYAPLTGFSESMTGISKRWISGSVGKMETMSRVIRTIMIFLIALNVMWMLGGMFDLMQQLNKAVHY